MLFEDIAKQMGISDTRVHQLYQRALGKIRKMIREDPLLSDFLDELIEFEDTIPDGPLKHANRY